MKLSYFIVILVLLGSCKSETTSVSDSVSESASVSVSVSESKTPGPQDEITEEMYNSMKYGKYGFDMLMGYFDPAEHADYVLIDKEYADREGMYLHKDTYEAFKKMNEAALEDGIKLVIRSATRNFDYQKGIWERKWNGETKVDGEDISQTIKDPKLRALKILEYSSMPSTSRHHWGTDMDLNSFDNEWFETGEGRKLWDWLETHAGEYGFCRPYTAKGEERPEGYFEERWHWSYMPLAKYFTDLARKQHSNEKIKGFLGAEVAEEIDVVEKYVFGINKDCL